MRLDRDIRDQDMIAEASELVPRRGRAVARSRPFSMISGPPTLPTFWSTSFHLLQKCVAVLASRKSRQILLAARLVTGGWLPSYRAVRSSTSWLCSVGWNGRRSGCRNLSSIFLITRGSAGTKGNCSRSSSASQGQASSSAALTLGFRARKIISGGHFSAALLSSSVTLCGVDSLTCADDKMVDLVFFRLRGRARGEPGSNPIWGDGKGDCVEC